MGQQVAARLYGQRRRIEGVQYGVALFAVADHGVGRDDVLFGIGRIDQFDVQRLIGVGEFDDRFADVLVGQRARGVRHVTQFGVHVPVGVGHAQRGFAEVAAAHRRVGEVVGAVVRAAVAFDACGGRCVVDASSEVVEQHFAVRSDAHDHRKVVGPDVDDLRFGGLGAGADHAREQGREERFQQFFHRFESVTFRIMRAHAYSAFSLCGDKVTKKIALRSKNRRIIFRCETSGPTGTLPLFRIEFQWSAVHGLRGSGSAGQ